jgi:aminoglycoside 3-N-acetyltransferase
VSDKPNPSSTHVSKVAAAVARSVDGPVTRERIVADLRALGVRPGMVLMVHTSVSALGFVIGGAVTVYQALREAVGPEGTLVLPGFCDDNSEPSHWKAPPVPEEWWPLIRAYQPAFDPDITPPESGLGALPRYFHTLPGTRRSYHPGASWLAQGPQAEHITADHSLDFGLGDNSPNGRCYALDAWVLSLGCRRTSVLHLAENRSRWGQGRVQKAGAALLVNGARQWVEYDSLDDYDTDFEDIRLSFIAEAEPTDWVVGDVGYGESRLLRVRPLVDFGTAWIDANR